MSVYEASITNPKKQLEFYKVLSEQLQKENKDLKEKIILLQASEPMLEFAKQTYKTNWNELKKMIEDSTIAINECTKEPNNELNSAIKGTFGRVLNMMQELEGRSE